MGTIRFAGVDLSSQGAGYVTLDGVKTTPPVRGSNILIPYQYGSRWVRKYYDERTVVIQGIIKAQTESALDTAIDSLKALFPINSGEQLLEVQQADTTWRYVMAEARNWIIQVDIANVAKAAKWSLELVASDPLWYADVLATPANLGAGAWTFDSGVMLDDGAHWFGPALGALFATTLTAQVTVIATPNIGTTYTRKPVFTLTGAMTNPKITNARNGYSVQFLGALSAGSVLVLDCGLQRAMLGGGIYPNNSIVLGAGQTDWMRLETGTNNLSIDVGLAAPSVAYQVSYSPAYL